MRWLALAMLVGCAGGASDIGETDEADTDTDTSGDTDTDTEPGDEPQFNIIGEYTLGAGEMMPEDAAEFPTFADWVWSVDAGDFPEYTPCMGEVVWVDQGLVFETGGTMLRRFDIEARTCSADGTNEHHTIYVDYGSWAFSSNAEPDSGDLYTVNGTRTWRIYPVAANYVAREGAVRFTLGPD